MHARVLVMSCMFMQQLYVSGYSPQCFTVCEDQAYHAAKLHCFSYLVTNMALLNSKRNDNLREIEWGRDTPQGRREGWVSKHHCHRVQSPGNQEITFQSSRWRSQCVCVCARACLMFGSEGYICRQLKYHRTFLSVVKHILCIEPPWNSSLFPMVWLVLTLSRALSPLCPPLCLQAVCLWWGILSWGWRGSS